MVQTDGPEINLGWEPQWVMIKSASTGGSFYDWYMFDNMRKLDVSGSGNAPLLANASDAEGGTYASSSYNLVQPTPTGFITEGTAEPNAVGANGQTYIYIAIRRGPMRAPTSGTEVFDDVIQSGGTTTEITTGFPVDLSILRPSRASANQVYVLDRLREPNYLQTATTNVENIGLSATFNFKSNTGVNITGLGGDGTIFWNFRRAPGFFDVVTYTGNGNGSASQTLSHSLGSVPGFIIVKTRSVSTDWACYHASLGVDKHLKLNTTDAVVTQGGFFPSTPTSSTFTVGQDYRTNWTGVEYIAYLFATLPGVSKVGSYTGNGSSQTIDCGFTSGARFILIKRTDSTGDWYVWDTARGIVTGNDPFLELNTTDAEVTSDDSIDPDSQLASSSTRRLRRM
jgi:hypothetical protein